MKKVLIPIAASVAVLAVFLAARLLSSPEGTPVDDPLTSSSTGEPGAAGGGSAPDHGSPVPGDPGTGLPPDPGSVEPVPDPTTPARLTNTDGVSIASYYRYDARRLALNYAIGVPACYGTVDEPQVVETDESVTVTLSRVPPPPAKTGVACIDIALMDSVDITLSAPLGDRVVLDGSFETSPVSPAAAPFGDGSQAR